jgi:chorismate mutase
MSADEELEALRAKVTEIDRSIIEAVNRRLEIVAQIKAHKKEHGMAFLDVNREEEMLARQSDENRGPLSEEGLRALHAELLALTKRELD